VPKVLYGIFTNIVSVQNFAKTKNEKTMTSVKSLLPASDYTNIRFHYTWYTLDINEAPFCCIRPVDLSRLSWLDRTIRSNLNHQSSIIHRFVMSMPSYTVNQLLQFTTVYRRWYVIYTRSFICHGRPSLAVENRIYCLKGNYLLHIIHHVHKKSTCHTQLLHLTIHTNLHLAIC